MAFGTKYRIQGTSDVFGKITVNIKLNLYTGAVTTFEGAGRTWIELSVGQGGNDISLAVLPSSCSVQFYAMTDFVALELAELQPFTWLMEVEDNLGNLIWTGYINPEQYTENYHSSPYVVTINATCGLDELKTIPYTILPGQSATLWQHLLNCLFSTGFALPILESVNIYDASMGTLAGDSPLRQASVSYETFLKLNDEPNCYDVLVAILKPFYSRIYQYRGWVIENIYEKGDFYTQRIYDTLGNYVTFQNINPRVTLSNDPLDFKGFLNKSAVLSYHPALNSTEIYFDTVQILNPNATGGWSLNSDWIDDNNLTDWANQNGINISRLPFGYNGSETIVRIMGRQEELSTQRHILSTNFPVNGLNFEGLRFSFDYWMNYPSIIILGSRPILYLRVEYTDSITNLVYYWGAGGWTTDVRNVRIDASPRNVWRSYTANINTLPSANVGNIRFRVYQLVKRGTNTNVELRLTNWATNLSIDQEIIESILRESGTNSIVTNFNGPSFQHFISDGTVVGREGVMDVAGTLTSTWSRRGKTDNINIRRLFILQWLSMHQRQAAKISGVLHQRGEKITPISVLSDNPSISTKKYIFTTWKMNLGNGIGDINYHELIDTDVTPFYFVDLLDQLAGSVYIMPDYSIPVGVPGLSPGVNVGGGGGSGLGSLPNFNIPPLTGDVRGDIGLNELTPAAIVNKPALNFTGLQSSKVAFNTVEDTPDQEQMTKTTAKDFFGAWGTKSALPTGDQIVIIDNNDSGELKKITIGAPFGVPPLNSSGKIPDSFINITGEVYLGTWNASTNTPTLANGTGNAGEYYRVTVGGTVNFGAGNITFSVGDDVFYNGTVWDRRPSAGNLVISVNGKDGVVVLDKTDIGLGNVDNTSDLNKPISTAVQTALNAKQDLLGFTPENVANKSTAPALGTSNTLYPTQNAVKSYVDNSLSGLLSNILPSTQIFVGNSSNLAEARALTLNATGGTFGLSNTGVLTFPNASASARGLLSSADWNTFNSKQNAITGGATTIVSSNLTINRALISDANGKVAVSEVTHTEIGYLSGVTSPIQTQLGGKAFNSVQILAGTGLTGGGDLTANRTLSLTGQALALHNLNSNGFIVRTGAGTVASRQLVEGTGIAISNPDGVAANPTISFNTTFGDGRYALVGGSNATGVWPIALNVFDTRNVVTGPQVGSGRMVRFDFLLNSTDGLNDGGNFHGVMTFQQWSDASGGGTRQLGFTDNNNLWIRGSGSGLSSYGAWKRIWDSGSLRSDSQNDARYVLKAGDTMTGDLIIPSNRLLLGLSIAHSAFRLAVNSNIHIAGTDPFISFGPDANGATPAYIQRINSNGLLDIFSNNDLRLAAGSVERMRILSAGNILIGTASELTGGGRLQVNGAVNASQFYSEVITVSFTGASQTIDVKTFANGTNAFAIVSAIKSNTGVHVAGSVFARWNGVIQNVNAQGFQSGTGLSFTVSGSTLRISNTVGDSAGDVRVTITYLNIN